MNNFLNQTSCLSAEDIQSYTDGSADNALRFRVENHLLDCALCTAAVEGYSGKGKPGRKQLDAELDALRSRMTDRAEETPVRNLQWFNRAVAASVLVIIGFAGWLYWNHTRDERLFAGAFYPAESDFLNLRGNQDMPQSAELEAAMQMYEAKDFEAGLPYFRVYLAENPDDFQTALYAGIAALESGQNEQAVEWLEVVRFNDPERYAQATWYLALAHLRQGAHAESVALLEELRQAKDNEWALQAEALLSKLSGKR